MPGPDLPVHDEWDSTDGSHVPAPVLAPYVFNWKRDPDGAFMGWMLPTLISYIDPETFKALSAATDKWSRVSLTIQINGVEVDAAAFLTGIEHNMEHYAKLEAKELMAGIARISQLRELLDEIEHTVTRDIRSALRAVDVVIEED